jgi:serine/threonine protein kinase/Flp pilus assembly protein TadD
MSRPSSPFADAWSCTDPLVEQLAREMADAWRQGQRPLVEAFLARHPELAGRAEAVLRLVYEEVCLREECQEDSTRGEVLRRFPSWQSELEALLRCRPLQSDTPFPRPGETLGEFHLLAELGCGLAGRVYLASQPHLAGRTVVLKVTRGGGSELQSLARLQHSHIVPLYSAQDFPGTDLRGLCMPYLGGTSLGVLLAALAAVPPAQRTSRQLLDELDRAAPQVPPAGLRLESLRQALARASYVQALVSLGARLAEALHHAHRCGLVHLDLKPDNVLLTADAQPMLLDFHLAREPIQAGSEAPPWLGGTPGYMPPEQQGVLDAVRLGRTVSRDVDGRADLYSLAALLYEALGGEVPASTLTPPSGWLRRLNPQVSAGLEDVLLRCLQFEPEQRYPDAGSLAADLRRHLTDRPLHGVPNRSLLERWRKWRRRSPGALMRLGLLALAMAALLNVVVLTGQHLQGRYRVAEQSLAQGQRLLAQGRADEAERLLEQGLQASAGLPGGNLAEELRRQRQQATALHQEQQQRNRRDRWTRELARLADELRFYWDPAALSETQARALEKRCARVWSAKMLSPADLAGTSGKVRQDLLDLAVLWSALRTRVAAAAEAAEARRAALRVLEEAQSLCGSSLALDQERRRLYPHSAVASRASPAQTPWDHYLLGRDLLRAGRAEQAAGHLKEAVRGQPGGFWPHFYQGVCAYRLGQYADAEAAFRVCLALAPDTAAVHHNHALALAALGRNGDALHAAHRAVELDARLGPAWFHRGLLHYRQGRMKEAAADFHEALARGADPAATHYNLALVCLAGKDRVAALKHVRQALAHRPDHVEAQTLRRRLAPASETESND